VRGRGARRGAAVVIAAVVASSVGALVGAPGSAAGAALPVGSAAPAPAPPPGQGLSPEVAALPASSPELDAARRAQATVEARLARDRQDLDRTTTELERVQADRVGVTGLAARREQQVAKAAVDLERVRADLRALATEWFVTGFGTLQVLDPALSAEQVDEIGRKRVLAQAAADDTVASNRFVTERLARLRSERDDLAGRRAVLDDRSASLTARRDRLTAMVARDVTDRAAVVQRVESARLNADVDGTDMSTIALDAYWRAANAVALTDPRCGMTWWALAGIGRTESRHGTYQGSTVGADGLVSAPILGPMLDGSNGFALVPDSDGGALDGTSSTDRAVGPMQFLPSTWRTVGRDGSGDGRADPENLYDAAVGAALYLCRAGPVTDDAGLRRGYYSYNRSQSYVDLVMQRATAYRDALPLGRPPG
jgi:membrane-bound lytic murein transglycosylase B